MSPVRCGEQCGLGSDALRINEKMQVMHAAHAGHIGNINASSCYQYSSKQVDQLAGIVLGQQTQIRKQYSILDPPPKPSHSEAEFDPGITLNLAFEGFVTTHSFPDCVGNRSTQEEHRLAGGQRTLEEREETQVLVRGHLRECLEEGRLVLKCRFCPLVV